MSACNNRLPDSNLDDNVASQMLDNVLRSCDAPPSKVTLQEIQLTSKYRRNSFRLHRWIIGVFIALLLMVPVMFVPASMSMSDITHAGGRSATLSFAVDSLLPVFSIKALLNGQELPVVAVEYNSFSTEVTENGDLAVTITLVNGRSTLYDLEVDAIQEDRDAPVISYGKLENNELTVYITDEKSEVVLSGAYAIDPEGNKVLPISYDDATGTMVLPYYHKVLNLFVMDTSGNELHAVISTQRK